MTEHWINLGNVPSDNLRAVWKQMAHTFNRHIEAAGTSQGNRWRVLRPPTGTGKTEGLALYCALLSKFSEEEEFPGVIIIERQTSQADYLAIRINELADEQIAISYHSKNKTANHISVLQYYPVLVITHKAYELGLDSINKGVPDTSNWTNFHKWGLEGRKLIVIDESLDIIHQAQMTLDQVRLIQGNIPYEVLSEHPEIQKALYELEASLIQMDEAAKQQKIVCPSYKDSEKMLTDTGISMPEYCDFTPLRRRLKDIRFDQQLLAKADRDENKGIIKRYDRILKDVEMTIANWNYYARKGREHTINTADLIVPEDITGAVVLDATASSNLIYQLFDSKAEMIPLPAQARNYVNVTMHVSRGHAVGKTKMRKKADIESSQLANALSSEVRSDRSVFVCCQKDVEPFVYKHCNKLFKQFAVCHWGDVDGKNEWMEFDTAVIFGLPYRDNIWTANTFMALQGVQTTEWLRSEGNRPFRDYKDIRKELEVGQIVVSVVQAVNRIRCRRVVDALGNCASCDVFILLPSGAMADSILDGIKREMPGIVIKDWNYDSAKRQARNSDYEKALVSYMHNLGPGKYSMTEVKKALGMSQATSGRVACKLKDVTSDLAKALLSIPVHYEVCNGRAYLVKEVTAQRKGA